MGQWDYRLTQCTSWSNDDKNNGRNTLLKKIALAWSLPAKNAFKNVYGFSLNQLAFGHSTNLLVLNESSLATVEGKASSQIIADHLNSLNAARKSHVENEALRKMTRALQSQTRTATT